LPGVAAFAKFDLGWAYENGLGVAKDRQQAIEWYSKAADGGNPLARARMEGLTGGKSFWGVLSSHIAQIVEWLWRTV